MDKHQYSNTQTIFSDNEYNIVKIKHKFMISVTRNMAYKCKRIDEQKNLIKKLILKNIT